LVRRIEEQDAQLKLKDLEIGESLFTKNQQQYEATNRFDKLARKTSETIVELRLKID